MSRLVIIATMIMLVAAPAAFAGSHSAASKHNIRYRGITMWAPKTINAYLDPAYCYNQYTGEARVCAHLPLNVSNNYPFRSGHTVSCQGYIDQLNALEVFDVTLGPQQSYTVPPITIGYDTNTGMPSKLTVSLVCDNFLLSWQTKTVRVIYSG